MKSNKKLFAILTLTMFMMTLLPMAAFAGGTSPTTYSAAASTVSATNTSLDVYADTDDLAKITIAFKNNAGTALSSGDPVLFYIKSDRDAELGYVENGPELNGTKMSEVTGQGIATTVGSSGKVYVYVGSGITGNFKISIYNQGDADEGLLIGSATIGVAVGEGNIQLKAVDKDDSNLRDYDDPAKRMDETETHSIAAGHGVELRAYVYDGSTAIKGKTVTFEAKYENGTFYTIGTATTDSDGYAKYYFEQTKSGKYEYRAKFSSSDKTGVITINVGTLPIKTLELKTADGTKIGKGEPTDIEFYVKDKYGNLIKNFVANDFDVKVSSAPVGSKFEDMAWDQNGTADCNVDITKVADGYVKVTFKADKEGAYVLNIRSNADTRYSATINLESLKFDKATSLKFKLKNANAQTVTSLIRKYETNIYYGTEKNLQAGTLEVYKVNEAGVEIQAGSSDLSIASSDVSKVEVDNSGVVTIKKDAAGFYKITALYTPDNLVAVYDLKVIGNPVGILATPVVTDKNAAVTIQYVDKNGEASYDTAAAVNEGFTISVPSGVSASNVKDINKAGKGSFDLTATEYGKYNVVVLSNNKRIAGSFEVEFVMPDALKPVIGAKNVTMFIGATGYVEDGVAKVTDVAPFIQDGRTFVAVRPVADAFGCEIGWNEATQTVTLTRADKVVTIVIGSNVITVVEGGVTTTVTADVAAFIKDGRTVLPFRAVGDAFGATVNYDAATQAVSYQQ